MTNLKIYSLVAAITLLLGLNCVCCFQTTNNGVFTEAKNLIEVSFLASNNSMIITIRSRKGFPKTILNITHYLAIDDHLSNRASVYGDKTQITSTDYVVYRDYCRRDVDRFARYDNIAFDNDDPLSLKKYCDKREILVGAESLEGTKEVKIEDLLPNQYYVFIMKLKTFEYTINEPIVEAIRTKPGAPILPPQSDLASFVILPREQTNSSKANERNVRLYWRPVPYILLGSNDSNYHLSCINSAKSNQIVQSISNPKLGSWDLTLVASDNYGCSLLAENSYGHSEFTYIALPNSDQTTNNRFEFHVVNVKNNQYTLSWTPINRITSSEIKQDKIYNFNGSYTIYWCYGSILSGCNSLSGILKTNTSEYDLQVSSEVGGRNINFGISYIAKISGKNQTSGIIWATCIALESYLWEQKLDVFIPSSKTFNDHNSITVAWRHPQCEASSAKVASFKINFCGVSQVDGCSVLLTEPSNERYLGYSVANNLSSGAKYEGSSCKFLNIEDKFAHQATIKNLSSSTGYIIQVRYEASSDKLELPWSEPIFVRTSADPDQLILCRNRIVLMGFFVVLVCFIAGLIFYPKYKKTMNNYDSASAQWVRSKKVVTGLLEEQTNKFAQQIPMIDMGYVSTVSSQRTNSISSNASSSRENYKNMLVRDNAPRSGVRGGSIERDKALNERNGFLSDYVRLASEIRADQPKIEVKEEEELFLEPDNLSMAGSDSSFLENILNVEPTGRSNIDEEECSIYEHIYEEMKTLDESQPEICDEGSDPDASLNKKEFE